MFTIGCCDHAPDRLRARAVTALVVLLTGMATTGIASAEPKTLVTFCAMGDTPYTPIEFLSLPKQIHELPASAEFAVHLGDIKLGALPCAEQLYVKVAQILGRSKPPMFVVPGDNEWNDCANPDQAWRYWVKHFMRFDERWKHRFHPVRQKDREENFAFLRMGVLFVGLNLVGGKVHDKEEWKLRHKANLDWLKSSVAAQQDRVTHLVILAHATPTKDHDDFFKGLVKQAKKFERPILYLHGDGHKWKHDRPWKKKKGVDILRVQVDQGLNAPPVLVTVRDDPDKPFDFDRRRPKKKKDKKKQESKQD